MAIKFKTSMLDYCKFIMTKMSFNRALFVKEYRKSLRFLSKNEVMPFKQWVRATFGIRWISNA
jgi:hypothetical protein